MNEALPGDTEKVKQAEQTFRELELRKVLYESAIEKRESGRIVDAIKIILLGWNWRAYNNAPLTNAEFDNQIGEFVEANEDFLRYLEDEELTLETIEFGEVFGGEAIEEHISNSFNYLLDLTAIGRTGASKTFHMFYPDVFMMWDTAIVKAYHKKGAPRHWMENRGKGEHTNGTGECYVAFLKETQDFIRTELDLSQFEGKSPAKVMDEFNYATHTFES